MLDQAFPWCREWETDLKWLFAAYVAAKQAQSVLDYDDLLLYWSHLAAEPSIAADLSSRFDHVLVDEYQDTNRLQASILLTMKPDGRGVTVVGDDAQSIYSFRGATVRNILDFPQHFDPPAATVTLDRNYRSTQPILEASNAVIGLAAERYTKNLWTDKASAQKPRVVSIADEADQARYVVEKVLEAREGGMKLKSQAVLFRAAHYSATLEIELTRRNIPFVKFSGLKFLDSVHVKDVLAVLRWRKIRAIASRAFESHNCCRASGRPSSDACWTASRSRRTTSRLACRIRNDPPLVRAASRPQSRRRGHSHRRRVADGEHRGDVSDARALSHRTDA